jgi:hypothetical protein
MKEKLHKNPEFKILQSSEKGENIQNPDTA